MIRRPTVILLVIFLVLVAGVLFWQRTKQSSPGAVVTATSTSDLLVKLDTSSISGMVIQDSTGNRIELAHPDANTWSLVRPKAEATDSAKVVNALTQLLSARILSTPNAIPTLASIGLDNPDYTIQLDLASGGQFLINVGHQTPTETGYYVLTSDRSVYVVSAYSLDSILGLVKNPPLPSTPTPAPAELTTPTKELTAGTPQDVTPVPTDTP
jgi:hypothetical protein